MSLTSSSTVKEDALASQLPDPTNVLLVRLENWNHTVGLLQDYIEANLSIQKSVSNGLEKAKKSCSEAPKFDYASPVSSPTTDVAPISIATATSPTTGTAGGEGGSDETTTALEPTGIAEAFEEMRSRTELLINKSNEVEQQLKTAVLPQLDLLKGDIEKHYKGFKGPGLKGQKDVQQAKGQSQKYIESLGQHVASFGSNPTGKVDPKHDPYVEHRLVLSALHDQISKENSQTDAIVSVQNNFQTLERHIVQVLQQAISVMDQILKDYATTELESFGSIATKFNNIQQDHEWNQFLARRSDVLIPSSAPKRQLDNLTFANRDHKAAIPVLDGIVQVKSGKLLKSYSPAYFVLTPSKYLHQFKSQDFVQDPTPEVSLYLPDASVGEPTTRDSGKFKFEIEGKDAGKTLTTFTKKTFTIKTNTYDELIAWHSAVSRASKNLPLDLQPVVSPINTTAPVAVAVAAAPVAKGDEVPRTVVAADTGLATAAIATSSSPAPEYSPATALQQDKLASDVDKIHIGS